MIDCVADVAGRYAAFYRTASARVTPTSGP